MIIDELRLGPIVQGGWMFLDALLVSAILAWPVFQLLLRVGSKQKVSEYVPEHAKKQGTPTMGGLIAIAGILAAIGLTGEIDVRMKIALTASIVAFALIGFFDDFVLPKRFASSR